MKADTKIVIEAAQKCVGLALLVAVGACLLLLDVFVLHTGIRESSLTEIGQELILFGIAVTFWRASKREGSSGFCILAGSLFGCMLIRELDGPTDLIMHGIWKCPAWALALWSRYRGWQDLPNVFARTAEFSAMPSFGLMAAGLAVILVYSRLFGVPPLWQGILSEGYVKTAKHAAEEGTETLGYLLCLGATIDYIRDTRRGGLGSHAQDGGKVLG